MSKQERADSLWFAAGFVAGFAWAAEEFTTGEEPDGDTLLSGEAKRATALSRDAMDRRRRGDCVLCGRSGVVILDGFFCERCSPGLYRATGNTENGHKSNGTEDGGGRA